MQNAGEVRVAELDDRTRSSTDWHPRDDRTTAHASGATARDVFGEPRRVLIRHGHASDPGLRIHEDRPWCAGPVHGLLLRSRHLRRSSFRLVVVVHRSRLCDRCRRRCGICTTPVAVADHARALAEWSCCDACASASARGMSMWLGVERAVLVVAHCRAVERAHLQSHRHAAERVG